VAAGIEKWHAKERNGRRKNRLLAIKLVVRGEHTSAQIADLSGIARGHLFAQTEPQICHKITVTDVIRTPWLLRIVSDLRSLLASVDRLNRRGDVQDPQ